ncbi:uncharacterized protein [Venturia canescens]|uniref:uncharacterized protein isoform X2 n=1 Tax=Venturia canescens TaxID=32260 RepID=UPI001C9CD61C|nr:uncharacterized protein LOC122415046 isoform X2 [Venturia canescens]
MTHRSHYCAKYRADKMFYWLIPYFVAYNLTEPAKLWKNGPVHTFEAEIKTIIVRETIEKYHSDITMLFECRPIATSFIKCQVENATLDNYEMIDNNETRAEREKSVWRDEFGSFDFHIEFDKTGIKNITFSEPRGYFREMIIRWIFINLNVGIDLTDKNFGQYDAVDRSLYGDCPTNFNIKKLAKRVEDKEFLVKRDDAVRELTIVPFLDEFSDDSTILIEKDRKMMKCLNKKSYMFGSDELTAKDRKEGFTRESNIADLRSEIYVGRNRFNSYSEHSGTFRAGIKSENTKNVNSGIVVGKASEKIRLTLLSIRPD